MAYVFQERDREKATVEEQNAKTPEAASSAKKVITMPSW
jgi:hypothetical protein